MAAALRLLVVDDHRSVAELFELALANRAGIGDVAVAHDGGEALARLSDFDPDVALVDARLGGESGIDLVRTLRRMRPETPVVVMTAQPTGELVRGAMVAGAATVVPKHAALTDLVDALGHAESGQQRLHPDVVAVLVAEGPMPRVSLTPREEQVLDMLSRGRTVTAISRHLGVAPSTTRSYVKTLLRKLDAHSQLEAVSNARRMGIIRDAAPGGAAG